MPEPMEGTPSGVGSAQITDGGVGTVDIADGAVTVAKLAPETTDFIDALKSAGETTFSYINFI